MSLRSRAGAPEEIEPWTLVRLFLEGAEAHGPSAAMWRRTADGSWDSHSHEEVARRVRELSLGLRSLGYGRGDRIAIVSHTRMEWALADYALIMTGAVSVPVYPQLPPEQMRFVLGDSETAAAFVSDAELFGKIREVWEELPELRRVFLFEPGDALDHPAVMGLDELAALGRGPEAPGDYEAHARETAPDDLATLIYTSGTTGRPKGVMLTHDNFSSNARFSSRVLPVSEEDRALSWLPLAHVFERTAGHYLMWLRGVTVAYAESLETLVRDMGEVRPTIMNAVPRLYEKLYEGAAAAAREKGALGERLFGWAERVGRERADRLLVGESPGWLLGLRYRLADRLVFRKLRARTGGKVRYFISGGAPLSPRIGQFLWAADLPVLQGYGLTETSPVLCVNRPDAVRLETVGPPIPGTEIGISQDGEILARGPQLMKGYFRNEEATREVFTEDGWLRTGDIGRLDGDGFLEITGRKKEILVNAYGKNIAPAPVEEAAKASRFVEHAVLIADRRKFPILLVQPFFAELEGWARDRGLEAGSRSTLVELAAVRELLEREVEAATADLAEYERPGEVLPVPDEFGVESGELTPTMKVKRRVILDRYADEIDRAYERAAAERDRRADGSGGEAGVS